MRHEIQAGRATVNRSNQGVKGKRLSTAKGGHRMIAVGPQVRREKEAYKHKNV
jgi:hypothetical protein